MIRNPVQTPYRDWYIYEEPTKLRHFVISIPHRSYVSLNGYIWSFRVHEHA